MRDISFKNAKLNNVVFYNCNLKNADFTGASFSHVSFICTNTKVAKGLSESDDGISIYKTYKHIDLSSETESALIGLSKKYGNVKISIDADDLMLTDYTSDFDKKYKLEDKKVFQEFFER